MAVTGGEPVSTADLAEVLSGIQTATVLYETSSPEPTNQDRSQVRLSQNPDGFDYIEVYWVGFEYMNPLGNTQYGCKLDTPLADGARLPMPVAYSSDADSSQCTMNVSGQTFTLTRSTGGLTPAIRRVVGIRTGGGV